MMRMKRDFKYMNEKIRHLKQQTAYIMRIKFGKKVDINEIEVNVLKSNLKTDLTDLAEIYLKKMVFDVRMKNTDIKGLFRAELKNQKVIFNNELKKIKVLEIELIKVLKANTTRSELLRILKTKKKFLCQDIASQDTMKTTINKYDELIKKDEVEIKKLKQILENQEAEIQDLKDEIKMLKTKGYPPKPVRVRKKSIEEPEEKIDFEQYLVEEEFEERMPTEIIIPDTYYSTEAEDLIRSLIEDMFEKIDTELSKKSTENMVRDILEKVMKCTSCHEIVKELVDNIPISEKSEEQIKTIESISEKLFVLVEPTEITEEDETDFFESLIDDMIDETLLIKGKTSEVMMKLLTQIVDEVPQTYLLRKQCIDKIINRLGPKLSVQTIKDEILPAAEKVAKEYREDVRVVISTILLKLTEDDPKAMVKEQIQEIIDEVMLERGETFDVMAIIVEKLVMSISTDILMQSESIDEIVELIRIKFEHKILNEAQVLQGVKTINIAHLKDVKKILNIILTEVYGTGLDYLYIINKEKRQEE